MLSAEIFTQYAKVIITQRFYMNMYVFCTITIQVLIFYKAAFSTYIVRNLYEMSEPVFWEKYGKIFQKVVCWNFYPVC